MKHILALIVLMFVGITCEASPANAEGPIKDPQLEAVVKAILKVKQIDKTVIDLHPRCTKQRDQGSGGSGKVPEPGGSEAEWQRD